MYVCMYVCMYKYVFTPTVYIQIAVVLLPLATLAKWNSTILSLPTRYYCSV